jgi:hypothetical protein
MASPQEPEKARTGPIEVDYLDEDIVTVPGQAFALVSFVTKTGNQRTDHEKMGLKIRGAFGTRAEAEAHVKKLMRVDNLFDVWILDMYKWAACPPCVDDAQDVHYQEEYLNEMVKGYKESQEMAKQHFQERKQSIMEEGLDKNLHPSEIIPPPPGFVADPPPAADGAGASGST